VEFCDDHGAHPASYLRLKAEVFPVDDFSIDAIKRLIGELIANQLVREYIVDNKSYWLVTGWENHQRIDKPTYRHPLPLSEVKEIKDNSSNVCRLVSDESSSILGVITDNSLTDRNGKDWSRKEKATCEAEASPGGHPDSYSPAKALEIFQYWREVMQHPRAKLDNKRRYKIIQALNLGYQVQDLKQAIDGCKKTPFNMGQNDRGQRYDDIELILRDATHIDRFINNATNPPAILQAANRASDLMVGVI
jgi:hypothetical protein